MKRLQQFFMKCPLLYCSLRKIYLFFFLKYIRYKDQRNRNKLSELWAKGHFSKGSNTPENYWNSRNHPHRSFLVEKIDDFAPISSILEVGCNTGPNLHLLAQKYPGSHIQGVDINPQAVHYGNEWLARENITNASILTGRAEGLDIFPDKSFDVVFTDAVLIYVSPEKIEQVVRDIIRIARKGLVFMERHDFESSNNTHTTGTYINGIWIRDYVTLLKQFIPQEQIDVFKITRDIWPDEGWGKSGALIQVRVS